MNGELRGQIRNRLARIQLTCEDLGYCVMKGKCEKAGEHLQKLEALTSSVRALMGLERKD
jgi:hypothetical protein